MPEMLTWDDADEIAQILCHRFPDIDPQIISELEIARWVREIPTLVDAPPPPPPDFQLRLEAIRAAWQHATGRPGPAD